MEKRFIVLGSGCAKCTKTAELIERLAQESDVAVTVEKETDPMQIVAYGVMSTPAVVLDGEVIHKGSIPHRDDVIGWFKL